MRSKEHDGQGTAAHFPRVCDLGRRVDRGGRTARRTACGRTAHGHVAGETWEKQNGAALDNAAAKRGLRLLWFSTGKDDSLITTTRATVELLKKHGFTPVFIESEGAHTWLNWRNYLAEFTPQLFVAAESRSSRH